MEQRLQEEVYWKERWSSNRTGWHLSSPHSTLVEYIELVAPRSHQESVTGIATSVVFLPLCGKTLDIHWLRDQGYGVVGCEISEDAVKQLFDELGERPQISMEATSEGKTVPVWETRHIKIYHCNFFDLGKIDVTAVYDRAALVALPPHTRQRYTQHMLKITGGVPQLVIAFEHQRDHVPPYSVPFNLIKEYYGHRHNIEVLSHRMAHDDLIENAYLLLSK